MSMALQTSKNHLKLFKYFKNKIFPNGILFLQEMHSTKENEINCNKSNSCEVLIGFSGNKTFTEKLRRNMCDENDQILILEILIDDSEFILINFYNANTESEQIQTFNELNILFLTIFKKWLKIQKS